MSLSIFIPPTLAAQSISSSEWQSLSLEDDFTDKVDRVGAVIQSQDTDSTFGLICQSQAQVLSANISFSDEYLGKGDETRVRWRIGDREAHVEQWILDGNSVKAMLYEPRIASLISEHRGLLEGEDSVGGTFNLMTNQSLVYELLSLPEHAPDMIFEVTDHSGDRHRGKITLRGAKEAVREVLNACPKWNSLSKPN